jgi:hypothetical protein
MRKLWAAVALAAGLGVAGAAQAQVISNFPYTLTGADPTFSDYHFDEGAPCNVHTGLGGSRAYQTVTISFPTGGAYSFDDTGAADGAFAIYTGAFDPLNPTVGCLASADVPFGPFNVPAGTYTLVLSAWYDGDLGNFQATLNGPGPVNIGPLAVVPTMTEWSMILFALLLAAGAAWQVQHRRAI